MTASIARIRLSFYAALRAYSDGKPWLELEIQPGETVGQVLDRLGVPREQTRIVFVNNRGADLASTLQSGDQVGIFPAIGGG